MSQGLRVCKKCLLREQSKEVYFEKLARYIESLEEEDRVPQEVYEERLRICSSCEYLLNGMCRFCGCFVELRAALRVRKCPALPERWQKYEE